MKGINGRNILLGTIIVIVATVIIITAYFCFFADVPVVSAEENAEVVAEYTFEEGTIQFITSQAAMKSSRYWEADVYFPSIQESHTVIIPDSVLDDISVGWTGYFGFRPDYYSPQWVGLDYNP